MTFWLTYMLKILILCLAPHTLHYRVHTDKWTHGFGTPQTYTCTDTQTHAHTCADIPVHTDTDTHRHMHTDTHMYICLRTHMHTDVALNPLLSQNWQK